MTAPGNPRRSADTVRKAQEPASRRWLVPAIIGGVVAVAAIIAIALAGGGDGSKADTSGLEQVQPVEVQGTPLPSFGGDSTNDPAIGMTIPTVTGKSFDGTPVTIQPTGSPQMLMFVAHWCPHCQREVPLLSPWLEEGGLPAGVQLTTVATGTSADAPNYPPSAWLEKNSWPSPIMADSSNSDAANAFGLEAYPYFVFVDADGKVVGRASGELTIDQLDSALQQLASQASG